jgi:hypothetical protein
MSSKSEQAIRVYIRVRPPISKEVQHKVAVQVFGGQGVQVNAENKEISCNFDKVFGETTSQEEVFQQIKPALVDVLSGINACIFAYGQTSSGKSHTMIGPNGGQDIFRIDPSDWGILPRAAEYLLDYLNDKADEGTLTYEVKASFLQIYNENLYDLLRDTGPKMDHRNLEGDDNHLLKIREVPKSKASLHSTMSDSQYVQRNHTEIYIAGLSEYRVETSEDIMKILMLGTKNRMTRSTDFNLTSSRSHAILQLTFTIETQLESGQTIINKSKLNLIDLAGSEKLPYITSEDTMPNYTQHVKELTSINKSLSCLGNVISALTSTTRIHVPYRDSKLTRILQDSLGGNTKTIVIACVAPTVLHASESISTLQFADRAKHVKYIVRANTIVDDKFTLAKAQAEITRLKMLLANALKQLEDKQAGLDPNYTSKLDLLTQETSALKEENAALRKLLQQCNIEIPTNLKTVTKSMDDDYLPIHSISKKHTTQSHHYPETVIRDSKSQPLEEKVLPLRKISNEVILQYNQATNVKGLSNPSYMPDYYPDSEPPSNNQSSKQHQGPLASILKSSLSNSNIFEYQSSNSDRGDGAVPSGGGSSKMNVTFAPHPSSEKPGKHISFYLYSPLYCILIIHSVCLGGSIDYGMDYKSSINSVSSIQSNQSQELSPYAVNPILAKHHPKYKKKYKQQLQQAQKQQKQAHNQIFRQDIFISCLLFVEGQI